MLPEGAAVLLLMSYYILLDIRGYVYIYQRRYIRVYVSLPLLIVVNYSDLCTCIRVRGVNRVRVSLRPACVPYPHCQSGASEDVAARTGRGEESQSARCAGGEILG